MRTRTPPVQLHPSTHWTRLEIVEAVDDVVEFRAHFDGAAGAGVQHEQSLFEQRAGRWFYLSSLD